MTTRSYSARLVQCFVLALLGMILDVTAAQAKKADSDKSRDDEGGKTEKPSRELPAAALFGRVSPSIVVVEVVLETGTSQGSGVVIGPGQIVTNHHVVDGGRGVQVRQGSRSWPATIEALEPHHNLALLRVKDLDLPRVSMRPSTALAVGERVYAVGAPQGLELSLSDGLVSALRRDKLDKGKLAKASDDESGASLVQTTAPVSPGSSGGGLFDGQGRLVGIITFHVKGGQNLNFAHPTEWVEELRAQKGGDAASHPKAMSAPYGLTQRPWALKCVGDTRAVWGVFRGGSEILATEAMPFNIDFDAFNTETPSFFSAILYHPKKGEVVLSDVNRDAGFVRFTSTEDTEVGFIIVGNGFVPLEFKTRKTEVDYFFSPEDDGHFRLTIVKPFEFHGKGRVLALSGACKSIPKPRQTDERAEAHCKAGDIAACIAEGKALEKTNRVGALALYLKGCSQSDGKDPSKRALAADACSAAARLVDVMGDKAYGERLRKQAAELRAQK